MWIDRPPSSGSRAADTINSDTLRRLGIDEFERAIVGIGTDIEASLMTVFALSDLWVSGIWAKVVCQDTVGS